MRVNISELPVGWCSPSSLFGTAQYPLALTVTVHKNSHLMASITKPRAKLQDDPPLVKPCFCGWFDGATPNFMAGKWTIKWQKKGITLDSLWQFGGWSTFFWQSKKSPCLGGALLSWKSSPLPCLLTRKGTHQHWANTASWLKTNYCVIHLRDLRWDNTSFVFHCYPADSIST